MSEGIYQTSWAMQSQAASSVGTAIGRMDSELQALDTQVSNLIGTWDSDARDAYLARQQQWTAASANIKSALSQFVAGLNSSADTASSTESRNVGVVSG